MSSMWQSTNDPFTVWADEDQKKKLIAKMPTIEPETTFCAICCEDIVHKTTREFQVHQEKCKASEYKRIREQASNDAAQKMKASLKEEMTAELRKELEEEIRAELKAEMLQKKGK